MPRKLLLLNASALVVAGLCAVAPVSAVDPYESAQDTVAAGDDTNATSVSLTPGFTQVHDLDQAGGGDDQDWMALPTLARHSYEVRISGNVFWGFAGCGDCADIARVDAAGAVLTQTVAMVTNTGGPGARVQDRSIRWIASASTTSEFVRASGGSFFPEGPNSVYSIRLWDSTYSVPRWNNANGQVTVVIIQNLVQAHATVRVDFYDGVGTVLATDEVTLQAGHLRVLNTATIPALANQSGYALVAHTAGYGGLSGKAVALEPATGFSFDSPLLPIAQ